MNEKPTYAQLDRLHGWFSVPYEELEKLTFQEAKQLIGEVYQSNMSQETMSAFRQRVERMTGGTGGGVSRRTGLANV